MLALHTHRSRQKVWPVDPTRSGGYIRAIGIGIDDYITLGCPYCKYVYVAVVRTTDVNSSW